MTYPELPSEHRIAPAEASNMAINTSEPEARVGPNGIFDPESFDELQELLGSARVHAALEDFSLSILELFQGNTLQCLGRDEVFDQAHSLVASAGMLGFPALRDASYALQEACRAESQIYQTYERAREAGLATRETIALLLQRPV